MTELKCPFCGEELDISNPQCVECKNDYCYPTSAYGSKDLWQALIDTKKKLDEAIDLLKMLYGDYNLDWAVVDSDKVYDFLKQINQKEEQ